MAVMIPTFQPSKYQQDILEFVRNGKGNAVVLAVPGSGKSTTLLECAKQLPTTNARIVAFNKHIQDEMTGNLKAARCKVVAKTMHSMGFQALMKNWGIGFSDIELQNFKYNALCREALKRLNAQNDPIIADTLKQLIIFSRVTLAEPTTDMSDEQLWVIATQYELDVKRDSQQWKILCNLVPRILHEGRDLAVNRHLIDFSDQLWIPLLENMVMPQLDWLLVDEAQDLNPAQLELVLRCVAPGGRSLFVGDANQSICGFSGADTKSMEKIIERTQAVQLPLSICYRCATSIIEQVAMIYPGIEAAPNAPVGSVSEVKEEMLHKHAQPNDLILCRMTAPLVEQCIHFIRNGVRAQVRGRDLGKSFIAILNKLKEHPEFSYDTLLDILAIYAELQYAEFDKQPDAENLKEVFGDKIDTVKAFYDGYNLRLDTDPNAEKTLEAFEYYIEQFFSDSTQGAVIFSTVHRAKGLEADNVYILKRELMPLSSAKTQEQQKQEKNLKYVAFTRAKKNMYFIVSPDEDRPSSSHSLFDFADEDEEVDY